MTMLVARFVSTVAWAVLLAPAAHAQQTAPQGQPLYASKPILVSPVSGDDKKQLMIMSVSIQPSGAVPLHTHPGDCVGSVVEGTMELMVQGQPSRRVAAGETYSNLRGTVHGFRNAGDSPARLLNTLLVEKGVPAVQPVAPAAKP